MIKSTYDDIKNIAETNPKEVDCPDIGNDKRGGCPDIGDDKRVDYPDIKFVNFSKKFGDTRVFDDFGVCFLGGKINAIMGPSGAGKTTLLNAVAGLIEYEGQIEVGDENCVGKCNASVSYVFQQPRLINQKTVFGNLDFSLCSAIKNKDERRKKIVDILGQMGLGGTEKLYPSALSGGMAQRVSLARAFLYPSNILLMDEPFKGLDKDIKSSILGSLLDLLNLSGKTVLFVTHDKSEALALNATIFELTDKPIIGQFFSDV